MAAANRAFDTTLSWHDKADRSMTVHHHNFRKLENDPVIAAVVKASPDRPFVIAQLGQSLDGRIATPTGASRWINGSGALDHLHRLRANVDAVVVGVGTVTHDDPELTVRRVEGRNPARVVIDPNNRMPFSSRCLADDGSRRIIFRKGDGVCDPKVEYITIPDGAAFVDPKWIVDALYARGLGKILIEGGARTVSGFIDSGAVDRLHVLVAPVILGSGIPGLSLAPIATMNEARRPLTRTHVLDGGDVLFDCDLRGIDEG
ncbi:MAG TPA: RibD family protein [Hyphomicrobium sp.]|nr:RibD family protein [Hyphomicrobium sp.]